jgi:hypothetical protein
MSLKGVLMMIVCAVVFAIVAYAIAPKTAEDPIMARWEGMLMPNDVIDGVAFVQAGYSHKASYLGGLIGLIAALIWLCQARHHFSFRKLASIR